MPLLIRRAQGRRFAHRTACRERFLSMALTPTTCAASPHLARLELGADEERAMLDADQRLLRIVEQMARSTPAASSRCPRRCRRSSEVPLRLREDVVTEGDERERQPAQRAGGGGRPVPGAQGDRMSAAPPARARRRRAWPRRWRARELSSVEADDAPARTDRRSRSGSGAFLARRRRARAGPGPRAPMPALARRRRRPAARRADRAQGHLRHRATRRPPPARRCSPAIASPFDATVVAAPRRAPAR